MLFTLLLSLASLAFLPLTFGLPAGLFGNRFRLGQNRATAGAGAGAGADAGAGVGAGNTACRGVTVLFARGTTERGLLGAVVGPPLKAALSQALPGQVTVTGVDYPANVAGFLQGGDPDGAETMAGLAQAAANACPNEKIVITGYSQGAQVARKAIDQLPAATQARISSIVLFGDPNNGDLFGNGLDAIEKTFCNAGDAICDGRNLILAPHLLYGRDAGEAAEFIASKV